jgi:hypothetical protein
VRLAGINIGGPASALSGTPHLPQSTDNVARGDFGLIGLAVMGQNLILNAADHGFNVVAFNRTVSKVDHFLANEAKGKPPTVLLNCRRAMLTPMAFRRQTYRGCPLHRGVCEQAQEAPSDDAPGHGWQASR